MEPVSLKELLLCSLGLQPHFIVGNGKCAARIAWKHTPFFFNAVMLLVSHCWSPLNVFSKIDNLAIFSGYSVSSILTSKS